MNIRTPMSFVSALTLSAGVLCAGPLNPPAGAVGASMKTLTEVEPRIAINAANTPGDADASPSTFKITQPGSYYLTGNITGESGKHGIEVVTTGVTIDLNGFCVSGVPGSLTGITIRNGGGVEVRNGTVRSWGGDGISAEPSMTNNRVIDVRAFGNTGIGIYPGNYSEARNCHAAGNGSHGIAVYAYGRVEGCTARQNGGNGIHAPNTGNAVVNCVSNSNTGHGINAVGGSCTVIGCTANSNTESGIAAHSAVVRDCTVHSNTEYGFYMDYGTLASGNRATSNTLGGFWAGASCVLEGNNATFNGAGVAGRAGFALTEAGNRVSNNHSTGNPVGFVIAGTCVLTGNTAMANTATGFSVSSNTNTLLTGNIATGNPTNYSIGAGNDSAAAVHNPGLGFTTTNPAANFSN